MKNIVWFLIIVLAGCVLNYIAYKEYKRETAVTETNIQVDAEVIENRWGSKVYYPILSYTYKNTKYTEQAFNSGSNPASYSVGDHVTAYIDPNNPYQIEIKSFFNQMGKPLILLFFGMMCLLASIQILKRKTI